MTIQRVSDIEGEPEVGQYYVVPCILYRGEWTPTLGSAHDDADYIGGAASERHWHLDARFLSARFLREHFVEANARFTRRDLPGLVCTPEQFAMNIIPTTKLYGDPVEQRMKCKRQMPEFPTVVLLRPAPWMETLEHVYRDASAKCGRCPHRGMPLAGLPEKGGKVICPGHGLQFDVGTGRMVPRC